MNDSDKKLAEAIVVWLAENNVPFPYAHDGIANLISSHRSEEIQRLRGALGLAANALREAEAILGGEYGDQYGPLCEMMVKLEAECSALSSPSGDATKPVTETAGEGGGE